MRTQVVIPTFLMFMTLLHQPECIVVSQQLYPVVFRTRIGYVLEGRYGWPIGEDYELRWVDIECIKPNSPLALPKDQKLNKISIHNCTIPRTPFADLLSASNINFRHLEKLQFINNYMETPYPSNFTAGLPIHVLEMWNLQNFHVSTEFYTSLINLTELVFGMMDVPPLPSSKSFNLTSLQLKYSPLKTWDNCDYLQKLMIVGLNKKQLPKSWPVNCTQLKYLHMESLNIEAVDHLTESLETSVIHHLESLSISNCSLVKLPVSLLQSRNLNYLDFSKNNLTIDTPTQFPALNQLKVLNMSNNKKLTGKELIEVLPKITALRELKLDGCGIYADMDLPELREAFSKLTSLEILSLNRLSFDKDIFMHYHFSKLSHLSMTNKFNPKATIPLLKLHGFPTTGAKYLTVDLRGNAAQHISIGPEHFETFENNVRTTFWLINKGYKLTVYLDSVNCDCNNAVLWRALREYPHFLAMPDLKCSHGGLFKDETIENLSCRKATVNGCLRRISRDLNYTTVDCSNNAKKFRWPQPKGFRSFNASGNLISSLDKAYLPDTLEWLDLRNNNISRLNFEQSALLFGNKGRRVWLAGNSILCDCDNQALLDALQGYQSLVQDYDVLTCADSDKPLRLVSVAELCRRQTVTVSTTVSLLVVLALIAALIARHYWATLRMILYAHGCCMSCLREQDIDEDRPFDAFLSFAHGDDQYVMEHLLPKLEGRPNFYRICIHYRDWVLGDWIPSQIMQSVRLSKRTIIVLSKNFVKSSWGTLEFRHANAGATADGRQRLIVLVLDDVLSENLSSELRGYLELNTYLKCDDPWFWEKLRYAMPHKEHNQRQGRRNHTNFGRQVCALAEYANYLDGEVLAMKAIEPVSSTEEVPSSTLNVIVENHI